MATATPKATFTNKTLVTVKKDKFGNTVWQEVQGVVKWPKSIKKKRLVEYKLKLEELADKNRISPTRANSLYEILKDNKVKYKKYHWFICVHNQETFTTTFESESKMLELCFHAYADKELDLSDDQKKKIEKEARELARGIIVSFPTRLDELSDWTNEYVKRQIEKNPKVYKDALARVKDTERK